MQAAEDRKRITDEDVAAAADAILAHGPQLAMALAGIDVEVGDLPLAFRRHLLTACRAGAPGALEAAESLIALGALAARSARQREPESVGWRSAENA